MKREFESVDFFCATADIWSTKRKSFIGVTVHWVDKISLERKSKVLACRRFESPHDAERIADILASIYNEFGISSKIICTVTDNASNFVKAFKEFGISLQTFLAFIESQNQSKQTDNVESDSEAQELVEFDDEEYEESVDGFVDFVDVDDIVLSSHFRCGVHTLCLIASKDSKNALKDSVYEKCNESALHKLNKLYKKTRRPRSSEIIRGVLKVALVLPCKTRWNSLFDSIEHILKFDLRTLNTMMLALDLPQFTDSDHQFLALH